MISWDISCLYLHLWLSLPLITARLSLLSSDICHWHHTICLTITPEGIGFHIFIQFIARSHLSWINRCFVDQFFVIWSAFLFKIITFFFLFNFTLFSRLPFFIFLLKLYIFLNRHFFCFTFRFVSSCWNIYKYPLTDFFVISSLLLDILTIAFSIHNLRIKVVVFSCIFFFAYRKFISF